METARCSKCRQDKGSGEFYLRQGKPGSWCKACYRESHRARYAPKHGTDDAPRDCAVCGASYRPKTRRVSLYCSQACKERQRKESGEQRDQHLQRKYGITSTDYDRMLAEQGGGCAICGRRPDEQRRYPTYLHVDHCHVTGKVRGLLCDQHNLLLGRFDHDPDLLDRAAAYLRAASD